MKRRNSRRMEILKRREEVAQNCLDGKTIRQIAESLKLSVGTICNDLKTIRDEWQEHAQESISRQKALLLARINHLETMAYEAFENSKGEQAISTQRGKGKTGSSSLEIIKQEVRRYSPGDPRFLQIIVDCIAQKCRLLGLNVISGTSGNDHLPVIGFEIVRPDIDDEMDEMNE